MTATVAVIVALLAGAGAETGRGAGRPAPAGHGADAAARARILEAAARRLGRPFTGDCSGLVLTAYREARVPVPPLVPARSRSESLHLASRPVDAPVPGDLAFFHDTYDRDHDGRPGDRFTHVALVEEVDGSRVTLLHRGGRGVERVRMDLSRPSDASANDPLRVRRAGDAPGTLYLAGELFAAFGELLGGPVTKMLHAGHAPETSEREPASR